MEFLLVNHNDLEILEVWFKDKELILRLGGTLPLHQWFQYVIGNPNYYAWMVYENNVPVGQINLEIYDDFSAFVSILTNPKLRNRGYGKRILEMLLNRQELSIVKIIKVEIEPDNLASLHCFKKVGFIEEGINNEGYINLALKV